MADLYFLTASDRQDLRNMLQEWRHRRINTVPEAQAINQMSPEVYVVKVPESGIDAAVITEAIGTGGEEDSHHPKKAECEVWKIVGNPGEGGEEFILENAGVKRDVFNFQPSRISAGFCLSLRDKFGRWLPLLSAPLRLAVLDEALQAGSSAQATFWRAIGTGTGGNEEETDETFEARDWLLLDGQEVEADTRVIVAQIDGQWYVIAASCPAEEEEEEE